MKASLEHLAAAVASMAEASEAASQALLTAGYDTEDMPVIREQVGRAAGTVEGLCTILGGEGERDEVFVLLHQINNQLTGILSLTLLVKDDLGSDHPSRAALDTLDVVSRDAAAVVRDVAARLKRGA